MPTTIILPDELTVRLQAKAESQHQPLDELVATMLTDVLDEEEDDWPSLDEIVARIKATPPDPASIHPATQSLAELLAASPRDPAFDLEQWNREWARVEAEMKAIELANERAEGRG